MTTAVASGDLSKKITVDVKGEILELKTTINVDGRPAERLRQRSDPRGPRGRHRGQAGRPGAACRGVGRHLEGPDRQRQRPMAGNLTGQVRNIAEVTTAVANGRPVQEDHRRREAARSWS
ncbi:HAMP domain-containing protein [Caulobacter segnis]